MIKKLLLICGIVTYLAGMMFAGVPQKINFQGRLTDKDGNGKNGTGIAITFSIYNESVGGSALWYETQTNITVKNGIFQVFLGDVTPLPASVFEGNEKYLQIQVVGESAMVPRQKIASMGYAFKSENADHAATADNATNAQTAGYANSSGNSQTATKATNGFVIEGGPLIGNVNPFRISTYWSVPIKFGYIDSLGIYHDNITMDPTGGGLSLGGGITVSGMIFGNNNPSNPMVLATYYNTPINFSWMDSAGIVHKGMGFNPSTGEKSAIIPHPNNSDEEIYFFTTESPKVALEDFGEAQLVNGVASVLFSESFRLCISSALPQIIVTPLGDCNGLYVTNRTVNGFDVKECLNGSSDISFNWRAVSGRKGTENIESIRKKQ